MHDANPEERLRSVLRQEGDGLPFTITPDELERRLALRRRARNGQRLSLLAAGVAALAVGTIFALGSGWFRDDDVAAHPSPSPSTSANPSPAATPEPTPRGADPLGESGQAVLVTPVGPDGRRPDAFEVTRYDPAAQETTAIATIPGSILPDDGWLDGGEGPPQVSATGWLAIPFTRGPNEDERGPAIAIVDLQAPDAEPWILDGYRSMSWDPTDKLVIERDGVVSVAWVMSRHIDTPSLAGLDIGIAANGTGNMARGPAIAVQDGARFLATREDAWGYVGFAGTFTATNDLPPVYQRTGLERPAGSGAHGLGMACDSGSDAASLGCYLVESNVQHEPVGTWLTLDSQPSLFDFAWAADGQSVWLLLDGRTTDGGQVASLAYAADPGGRIERARIAFETGERPRLLGIADEPTAGSALVVAVGDDQGMVRAFVLQDRGVAGLDGTAWFAGWAGDPSPYDPD